MNQNEILDPQLICETMNSYFISIGESLRKQLTKTNTPYGAYLSKSITDSMLVWDISRQEILHEISRLAPKKSAGPDNIGSTLIKQFSGILVDPLVFI